MKNRRFRILLAGLAVVAVLLAVVAAAGQARVWRPRPPVMPRFSVALERPEGTPFRTFGHRGATWILGEDGERYVVVLRNPTAERVEAVVSVDGRDAITGRVARLTQSRGYIVPPFGTVRVEGFRQSLDQVATFRFSSADESYSSRMGTPQNVGVIGVAFFRERTRTPIAVDEDRDFGRRRFRAPAKSKRSAPRAGAAQTAPEEGASNIGTEFGESRISRVVEVPFERLSNTPARVITLRYDDARGLEARGIDVFPPRPPVWRRVPPRPQAFADDDARFAPPPP
jgi:hypothetical protein